METEVNGAGQDDKPVRIWVTKYALGRAGVFVRSAALDDEGWARVAGSRTLYSPKHFALTAQTARDQVRMMWARKVYSLKSQLAKLEQAGPPVVPEE